MSGGFPLSEARPGARVTFGDHTGAYRIRRVEPFWGEWVTVRFWWRRARVEKTTTTVWHATKGHG